MDIRLSKIELARMILDLENQTVINKIWALVKNETPDFWAQLSKEQQQEIELGIEQLDGGERIEFKEFLKKVS